MNVLLTLLIIDIVIGLIIYAEILALTLSTYQKLKKLIPDAQERNLFIRKYQSTVATNYLNFFSPFVPVLNILVMFTYIIQSDKFIEILYDKLRTAYMDYKEA